MTLRYDCRILGGAGLEMWERSLSDDAEPIETRYAGSSLRHSGESRSVVHVRRCAKTAGLSQNYTFMSSRAWILSTLSAVALFAEWGDRYCGRCRLCGISSSSHGPSLRAGGGGLGTRGRSHRTRVTTLTVGQRRMGSVRGQLLRDWLGRPAGGRPTGTPRGSRDLATRSGGDRGRDRPNRRLVVGV